MELAARYYDGRTSRGSEVRVQFAADRSLSLSGEGVSLRFAFSELDIDSRLGNTPRRVRLPNGGQCEIADNDALDAWLATHAPSVGHGLLHRLESNLAYVLLAVAITAAFSWGAVEWGIPWMARHAAYALPASLDRQLGQGTLKTLDGTLFEPTTLDAGHRERLQQRFAQVIRGLDNAPDYRLEFRNAEALGPNAFALPSGIVVVTDQLVALSRNDEEVVAVLAHEVGHLEHRHSLRMAMQDSALALVLATVTGDPFSSSALAVALPTLLVHAAYSRDFETEADDYAYRYLVANGIPTEAFADILERMAGDGAQDKSVGFLSSHPLTQARTQRFRSE